MNSRSPRRVPLAPTLAFLLAALALRLPVLLSGTDTRFASGFGTEPESIVLLVLGAILVPNSLAAFLLGRAHGNVPVGGACRLDDRPRPGGS